MLDKIVYYYHGPAPQVVTLEVSVLIPDSRFYPIPARAKLRDKDFKERSADVSKK